MTNASNTASSIRNCVCANETKFRYSDNAAARKSCELAEHLQRQGHCDHVAVKNLFPHDNTGVGALYFESCFDADRDHYKCSRAAGGDLLVFAVRRKNPEKVTTAFTISAEVIAMPSPLVSLPEGEFRGSRSILKQAEGVMFPYNNQFAKNQHWEKKIQLSVQNKPESAPAILNVEFKANCGRITKRQPVELNINIAPRNATVHRRGTSEFVAASKEQQGSLLTWLGAQQGGSFRLPLVIVFTDIVRSTTRNSTLGDERWATVRTEYYNRSDRLVSMRNGYSVKKVGDGILAVFRNVADALDYAMTLYREQPVNEAPIRGGIHSGEVDINDTDVLGNEVNYAARVIDARKEDEKDEGPRITVSAQVKEALDSQKAGRHASIKWHEHKNIRVHSFEERVTTLWSVDVGE